MKLERVLVLLTCAGMAAAAYAQPAPRPTAAPARAPEEKLLEPPPGEPGSATGGAEVSTAKPQGPAPSMTVKDVKEVGAPPDLKRSSTNAGALKNLRRVSLREGTATVRLDGAVRTLKAGDSIAGDVVRSVEDTRIVLARPEGRGREAIVIVTFDVQGAARVRVFSTVDPNPSDTTAAR